MPKKHEPPKRNKEDLVYSMVRAGISSLGPLGPVGSELFQWFVTPPLQRRLDRWMEEVGQTLQRLETEHGINLDELQANDTFVDSLLQASQIAIGNQQNEKRTALRNAVINCALPHAPEQSVQQIFLKHVDTSTIWHLRILKFFDDPLAWAANNKHELPDMSVGSLLTLLQNAYPDLPGELCTQLWSDLNYAGLVNTESLHGMMTKAGLVSSRTTDLGKRFLRFIEEPADD